LTLVVTLTTVLRITVLHCERTARQKYSNGAQNNTVIATTDSNNWTSY